MIEADRQELLELLRNQREEIFKGVSGLLQERGDELVKRIKDLYGIHEDQHKVLEDLLVRVEALEQGVDPAVLRDRLEKARVVKPTTAERPNLTVVKD